MKNLLVARKSLGMAGLVLLSGLAGSPGALAREPGWDVGIDVVFQEATTLKFAGGTTAALSNDIGMSLDLGYVINEYLEAQAALDWANVDYTAKIVTAAGAIASARGSYTSFTPRLNLFYNIMTTPITPFLMGGIGLALIDTSIPTGRPQTGCYWDPWYGYICSTYQSTKTTNGFAYQVGAGVHWDMTDYTALHLDYERHWVHFGSEGSPYVDQIKLGFTWQY